jgi:hypothetical protein
MGDILYVVKRDGSRQAVDKTKIKKRMLCHSYGLNEQYINYDVVVHKVLSGIYNGNFLNSNLGLMDNNRRHDCRIR